MTNQGISRRNLFSAQHDAVSKLNEALRPMGKKLWKVSELDSLRLTRILVWSEKYSVSLEYILETVLSVLVKSAERRTGVRRKGSLGVSIPVLTGAVAKGILLERLAKDFPGNENALADRERKKDEAVSALSEPHGKPKNPLLYETSREFIKAYAASVKRKRGDREEIEERIAAMPYRGNPYR